MNRPATLLLAALAAATTACASSSPGEPRADAPAPAGATASAQPAAEAVSPEAPATVAAGLFTEEQAARGRAAFRGICADCHYSSEFRDAQFKFKWGKRTVAELYRNIVENMPDDAPGSLPPQKYVDVVSYILQLNGFPPGASELTGDEEALRVVTLVSPSSPSGGSAPPGRRSPRTP